MGTIWATNHLGSISDLLIQNLERLDPGICDYKQVSQAILMYTKIWQLLQ